MGHSTESSPSYEPSPRTSSEKYEYCSVFGEVFEGLDDLERRLLLFFAVFPVGSVVKKRVLKNWWDGEGLLELSAEKTAEGILEEMMGRCLVEAVREGRRLVGFKMRPFVHFAVVARALEEGFFAFDSKGNPTVELLRSSRGCLVKTEEGSSSLDKLEDDLGSALGFQTLFNVSEPYPDFKLDFFLKLKRLKVLSLGKWQSSSGHHIEVDNTEFLKGLKSMRDLRLFSLRGISRVSELPDAVCKLGNLRILDLNACHNLEALPDGIGSLKKLIYLDISECYLLDCMPKELALLTELQVLKGFLIVETTFRESCSFTDLAGLKKLKKLSVYANRNDFPRADELGIFQKFERLRKLSISWGGRAILKKTESQSAVDSNTTAVVDPKEAAVVVENEKNVALNIKHDQEDHVSAAERNSWDSTKERSVGDVVAGDEGLKRARESADAGEIIEESCATTGGSSRTLVGKYKPTERMDGSAELGAGNCSRSFSGQDGDEQQNVTTEAEDTTTQVGAGHEPEQGRRMDKSRKAKVLDTRIRKILSKLPTVKQQNEADPTSGEVFKALEKLDLQCYPNESSPDWLKPGNMKSLIKLYIRGGKLHDFGETQNDDSWSVEILRLKFLDELEMNWDDVQALFPKLIYLEKFECKNLTTFLGDLNGVWVKRS
ncbi:disease resistance RPP13-like protein 4 isoform X2 [Punica granatum]|uniref:Disease resistance RPP13-like protein 4 isoform X2 n=1 Tax=Punica granatum TaxID=22663 RepID=A0A6P8C0C1_PUNGR|nr:disease resistance RPP13-like protein 4 isoform X2 [Punica granatum]